MEEGLGPGVVAAVVELSQEEGELGLQSLVVGGPAVFLLISGGLQRVWSQHTPVPPFSVKSLEVEMLERGIVCLVSGALALVFPVTVMCCPGFPGCPCGILQPHDDSEADMKSCGHSYSVQVSV